MLQKIFGRSTPPPANAAQVKDALSQLVLQSPEVVRATLVTANGVLVASYPRQAEDRVTAMSAAMLSLGERISGELGSGELRYVLITGARTRQLLVVLDPDYAIEFELRPNVSVDATLETIRRSLDALLRVLNIEAAVL